MSAPLVFMDTETTGLSLTDDVWEYAGIRRHPDGQEETLHLFIEHDPEKAARLPESFRADLERRYDPTAAVDQETAAHLIHGFTIGKGAGKPHIVGAVPNFDTERLMLLLGRFGLTPGWHYHLIDIENLAVGWLLARGQLIDLPWNSDEVSRACGLEPPTDARHTALGDALWARNLYDRISGHLGATS